MKKLPYSQGQGLLSLMISDHEVKVISFEKGEAGIKEENTFFATPKFSISSFYKCFSF